MSQEELLDIESSRDGGGQDEGDELDNLIDWSKVPPELEKEIKEALNVLKNNKSSEEIRLFKIDYGDFLANDKAKDKLVDLENKKFEKNESSIDSINEYILNLDPELKSNVEGKVAEWQRQIEEKNITDPVLATYFSTKPDVSNLRASLTSLALLGQEEFIYNKYAGDKQKLSEFKSAFQQLKSSFNYAIVPENIGKFVKSNHIGGERAFIAGAVISKTRSSGFKDFSMIDNVYYASKGHNLLSPERKKQIYVGSEGIETVDSLGSISIKRRGFENIDNKEYDKWNADAISINNHLLTNAKKIPNYASRENMALLKPTSNEQQNYSNIYNYLTNNYDAVTGLYEKEYAEEEKAANDAGLDKVEHTPELESLAHELKIIEAQIQELLEYQNHFADKSIPTDHLGEIDISDRVIDNNLNMLDKLGFQSWGTQNMNAFVKSYNRYHRRELDLSLDKLSFSDSISKEFMTALSKLIGDNKNGIALQEQIQNGGTTFKDKMKSFIKTQSNVDMLYSEYDFSEAMSKEEKK